MAVRSKTERSSAEAKGDDEGTSGAGVQANLVITVQEYSRIGYGLRSNELATNAEQGLLKRDGGGKRSRRDEGHHVIFLAPFLFFLGLPLCYVTLITLSLVLTTPYLPHL